MKKPGDVSLWMPMYWEKFLSKTSGLTAAETGAYICLIAKYWMDAKPLENDDGKLFRLSRMTEKEWKKSRENILSFFSLNDGAWSHEKVEAVLAESRRKADVFRERASAGGRAKAAKSTASSTLKAVLKECLQGAKDSACDVHRAGKGISGREVVSLVDSEDDGPPFFVVDGGRS